MDTVEILKLSWPTLMAGCLYILQAGMAMKTGQLPMAVVFLSYASANIGLIWAMVK